ncbi:MAG: hypothetical protein DMF98_05455 [Acidobacteria bacterium]|nr:MAG: hypothetical protein DMF98_05455 [Acidobacteriota bacterium]
MLSESRMAEYSRHRRQLVADRQVRNGRRPVQLGPETPPEEEGVRLEPDVRSRAADADEGLPQRFQLRGPVIVGAGVP